jgi:hypothetical protein
MTRFQEEDARQDDMLHLEGTKRFHDMTMDTDNTLVVIDPFNNQLKHEDKERTSDVKGRPRQQQGMEVKARKGRRRVGQGGNVASRQQGR